MQLLGLAVLAIALPSGDLPLVDSWDVLPYETPSAAIVDLDPVWLEEVLGVEPEQSAERPWTTVRAVEGGVDEPVAWARARVELDEPSVLLATLVGADRMYVDGVPYAGRTENVSGHPGVPVAFSAGVEEILVRDAPDGFELRFVEPDGRVLHASDVLRQTELVRGQRTATGTECCLPVINASVRAVEYLHLHYDDYVFAADPPDVSVNEWSDGATIPPLGLATARCYDRLNPAPAELPAGHLAWMPVLVYAGRDSGMRHRGASMLPVAVRDPGDPRRLAFQSSIDGSTQWFGLLRPERIPRTGLEVDVAIVLEPPTHEWFDTFSQRERRETTWLLAPSDRDGSGLRWRGVSESDVIDALVALEQLVDPKVIGRVEQLEWRVWVEPSAGLEREGERLAAALGVPLGRPGANKRGSWSDVIRDREVEPLDRSFVFVYGTGGSDVENQVLLERARFDQMRWFHRAGSAPEVLTDREFLESPRRHPAGISISWDFMGVECRSSNVLLYGNAQTNLAWDLLVGEDCETVVRREHVRSIADWHDIDHAFCAFVTPRADDPTGETRVTVLAGTSALGDRLGEGLRLFEPEGSFASGTLAFTAEGVLFEDP